MTEATSRTERGTPSALAIRSILGERELEVPLARVLWFGYVPATCAGGASVIVSSRKSTGRRRPCPSSRWSSSSPLSCIVCVVGAPTRDFSAPFRVVERAPFGPAVDVLVPMTRLQSSQMSSPLPSDVISVESHSGQVRWDSSVSCSCVPSCSRVRVGPPCVLFRRTISDI